MGEKDLTNKMYYKALLLKKSIPLMECWRVVDGQRIARAETRYATPTPWQASQGGLGEKIMGLGGRDWLVEGLLNNRALE